MILHNSRIYLFYNNNWYKLEYTILYVRLFLCIFNCILSVGNISCWMSTSDPLKERRFERNEKTRIFYLHFMLHLSHFTAPNHFDYSNKKMTSNLHRLNVKLK